MYPKKLKIENMEYPIIELPNRPKGILDRHIAEIFGVETREVNQAVKNNLDKFPSDFFFELTKEEVKTCGEIKIFDLGWKGGYLPKCFTPEGCNMMATILKTPIAIQRSLQIVRGFTKLEQKYYEAKSNSGKPTSAELLTQAKLLVQTLERQAELEEMQTRHSEAIAEHDEKIRVIEAKQDAVLKQTGFFTVLAYGNLKGIKVHLELAQILGKMAAKISKELGSKIGEILLYIKYFLM